MKDDKMIYDMLVKVHDIQMEHSKELTKQSVLLERHTEVLDRMEEDVKYHIKRTDLLEKKQDKQSEEIKQHCAILKGESNVSGLIERVETLEEPTKFYKMLNNRITKLVGGISVMSGIVVAVIQILKAF